MNNNNDVIVDTSLPAEKSEISIEVKNVNKQFWHIQHYTTVLNNLSLKCGLGQIYVLYGAFKSGKTTLLKMILSLSPTNYGGEITYFNHNKLQNIKFGYMPQIIGLHMQLTVEETVSMFAHLMGIDDMQRIKKFGDLKNILGMVDINVPVWSLQNHQKRLLSFFISIMDDPNILILDEPTSGCDPVYKNFIWTKIRLMASKYNVTILLSTTHVSDCLKGDVMGYLKNGNIIAEDSPSVLMHQFSVSSIINLIYCLSVGADDSEKEINYLHNSQSRISMVSGGFTLTSPAVTASEALEMVAKQSENAQRMSMTNKIGIKDIRDKNIHNSLQLLPSRTPLRLRIFTLLKSEIILGLRKSVRLFLHIALPIFCLFIYFFAVQGKIDNLELGIVQQKSLKQVRSSNNQSVENLINFIDNKNVKVHVFESYDKAKEFSKENGLHGILTFSKTTLKNRFDNPNDNIELELDETSKVISKTLEDNIEDAYERFLEYNHIGSKFIQTKGTLFGRREATEIVRLVWGAVAVITHFCGVLLGSLPLAEQYELAICDRFYILGVRKFELLLVHWAVRLLFASVQNFLIIITVLSLMNDWMSLECIFIGWSFEMLQTICGFCFGMILFELLKDKGNVILFAVIVEILLATISGFLWHYSAMHHFFQLIGIIIPHYTVSEALNSAIIKDLDISSRQVYPGIIVPLSWTVLTYTLYLLLNKFKAIK